LDQGLLARSGRRSEAPIWTAARSRSTRSSTVVYHTTVVAQLEQVFADDLKYSRKIEYQQWRGRGFFNQLLEVLSLPVRDQL